MQKSFPSSLTHAARLTQHDLHAPHSGRMSALNGRSVWVFDLDNTLYPEASNLFAEIDVRMGQFIEHLLRVPAPYARYLQKAYYRQFGTTLAGLMRIHRMPPGPFLDYVHEIDLSNLAPDPRLRAAIQALPGRKLIYTNGTVRHAERVAGKVGILALFEGIYDIVAADHIPKPQPAPYHDFLARFDVDPATAVMFEDSLVNLEVPHALGMATVHVVPDMARATTLPHAHVTTINLAHLLETIALQR